jgi:microcystin-dependent protein
MEGYIGEVRMFAGTYAPMGWMFCDGRRLNKGQYSSLFNIINYLYGKTGEDFHLPDMQGRVPIGFSKDLAIAAKIGSGEQRINVNNLPSVAASVEIKTINAKAKGSISADLKASIAIPCNNSVAMSEKPADNYLAISNAESVGGAATMYNSTANDTMKPFNVAIPLKIDADLPVVLNGSFNVNVNIGSNNPAPISVIQPSIGMNFIICVEGMYPPTP